MVEIKISIPESWLKDIKYIVKKSQEPDPMPDGFPSRQRFKSELDFIKKAIKELIYFEKRDPVILY
ncbi:MAG: hypothetical protein ACTSQP_07345 [Promethearchaeota archaeon]